jgi:hypothetical protein
MIRVVLHFSIEVMMCKLQSSIRKYISDHRCNTDHLYYLFAITTRKNILTCLLIDTIFTYVPQKNSIVKRGNVFHSNVCFIHFIHMYMHIKNRHMVTIFEFISASGFNFNVFLPSKPFSFYRHLFTIQQFSYRRRNTI